MNQRTIENEISMEGIGLHTGKKTCIKFKPAPPNEGIKFVRVDLPGNAVIDLKDLWSKVDNTLEVGLHKRRTSVSKGHIEVHTIEHLMAALWALSINNIIIEIDSVELPSLDGSAKEFLTCIEDAGIKEESDISAEIIKIKEPVWCEKGDAFIGIFPSSRFKISYILESPIPSIGRQSLSIDLDRDSFRKDIASARTFCLREEAEALLKAGFGMGANTQNTLVMDEKGPIENVLRFPDEPVRHKILDLIGDLYLLGAHIEGRVIGIRSGHELNMELVKKVISSKF